MTLLPGMSSDAATVTENASTPEGTSVTYNDTCSCGATDDQDLRREWRLGGGPHCLTCHSDAHRACAVCGACLPENHRWDKLTCSSTCRVQLKRRRDEAELARQVWEAENPEAAAKRRAERDSWQQAVRAIEANLQTPERRERELRIASLKRDADQCAKCDKPFAVGDTIYRRGVPVLPYCHEHRCDQLDGYHDCDAPPGRHYPACRCGARGWLPPAPCETCGRPVANDLKTANPWRFVPGGISRALAAERDALLAEYESLSEEERHEWEEPIPMGRAVHTFCGEKCRRTFFGRKRRTVAERACEVCRQTFTPKRADARYCSAPCRQRAYRTRKAAA